VRIALISDIHANMDALRVVLGEIDRQVDTSKGDEIWCLGDIIGYGPDPVECVDEVARRCKWALMGNHDFGVLYEPTNFNAVAEAAAYWTRDEFEAEGQRNREHAVKRWEFLGKLRVRVSEGPFLCVHGTPRRPINEYLFPEDAESSPNKMQSIFERIPQFCLVGHTHVPGVFTGDGDFYSPTELGDASWEFKEGEKVIVNPGSVGQPRDLDPRASYAIIDAERVPGGLDGGFGIKPKRVQFFRVAYDIDAVCDKIARVADALAAKRLADRFSAPGALGDEGGRLLRQGMGLLAHRIADAKQRKADAAQQGDRRGEDVWGRQLAALETEVGRIQRTHQGIAATGDADAPALQAEIDRYNWLGKRLREGR
jgi:diadenosine tetraphosphatase ApaH/serine/threonine PP2A family protein phosphatase